MSAEKDLSLDPAEVRAAMQSAIERVRSDFTKVVEAELVQVDSTNDQEPPLFKPEDETPANL